ncbi:MAG: ParB/RepB/Spo0J family partition protein [Chloroflexi bacterium]|nr:ParB/RepB/Spo0J family partition protein [Chloroflexota bacterium]OJV91115.1 MAG: hypothetical protein BGO39_26360 [Chloroflexi bacterium 54-19]
MAKTRSFLSSRSAGPASASDSDFESVIGLRHELAERPVFSQNLPVERIRPNPFQARQRFDALDELSRAIQTQGFISRLRVRPDPNAPGQGYFQLVYGERRLRAAILAGLTMLPCDVADYSDKEMLEIGLAENIQRQDLNPLEEAIVFQRLTRTGEYTIRELASRIGKNKDYVDGRLALLRAPQDVQDLVMKRPDTVTVARRIASLGSPGERRPLIEAVLEGTLNKEAVREIIRDLHTLEETPVPEVAVTEIIEVSAALPHNVIELESRPVVRPDGQSENKAAAEAPKKAVKSSQYNTRRINQETSMVLSILNRWGELDPETWQANHDSLNRSIQAIRDTLLELAELLAEAGGANLEQK